MGAKRKYAEQESFFLSMFINGSILLSMLLSFLYLAYAGIWFLIQLIRRKELKIKNRLILFLACFCFPLMFFSFGMAISDRQTCGTLTFFSALLFLSSLLMLIFSIWSLYKNYKLEGGKVFKGYYFISSLAISVVTLFFLYHGFIGLRLWAY